MHRKRPPTMMPMREQRASASSMLCVVSTTVHWHVAVDTPEITLHMCRLAPGSTPVLGSSKSTRGGEPMREMARDNFRLLPPLNCMAILSTWSSRSKSRIILEQYRFRTALGMHLIWPKSSKCSRTVRRSRRASCCGQYPRSRRTLHCSATQSKPPTVAAPPEGSTAPVSMFKVLVFPAPLLPRKPKHSPFRRPKLRPCTATFGRPSGVR
mmetsp:Transcript_15945/g.46138  ORF Transcript_15945/g.46138 Transcript_15945/m.46138 type:complete len:210 (-) Transcript_15945:2010-2639(-)